MVCLLDRGPGLAGPVLVAFPPEVDPESPSIWGLRVGWRVQGSRGQGPPLVRASQPEDREEGVCGGGGKRIATRMGRYAHPSVYHPLHDIDGYMDDCSLEDRIEDHQK